MVSRLGSKLALICLCVSVCMCAKINLRGFCAGHGDDYQVQLSVGQCPRSCIYYVTPSQRVILEDLLER